MSKTLAVDYLHRLLVSGPNEAVRGFRRKMHREYSRTVAGRTWTEIVPFSFAALYELAPAAKRIEQEIPDDPYELSVWPIRRVNRSRAEVRYQFQTRSLEMVGLLRALSGTVPSLTFALVTLCLDDSSIEAHQLSRGTGRRWALPRRLQDLHWNRARRKFGLVGDEVFDDDEAEHWAEEEMLGEALTHWDKATVAAPRRRRRYRWWNRLRLRDLATEQELAMYEMAAALTSKAAGTKPRTRAERNRMGRRAGR